MLAALLSICSSAQIPAEEVPKAPEKAQTETSSSGSIVVVPIPTATPALGAGATLVVGYIFPLRKSDTISPPSVIGGAGLMTDNGTRAFFASSQLYFARDRYRVVAAYGHGNLNYDFYGLGTAAGNSGLKLGLEQSGGIFFGEVLRRTFWNFFIGPRVWIASSTLNTRGTEGTRQGLPPLRQEMQMRALGFQVERDTSLNRFYPTSGSRFQFTADFFTEAIGSSFTFQSYKFQFDKYHKLSERQILAYDAYACSTSGDAPFYGECIFGMRNQIRGYSAGRYIDEKMLATQLEYRLELPRRFGLVAFAGVGEVASGWGKFNASNLLGSIGAGPRFQLSKKYHVNLRADFAYGRNGSAFSMGLAEAF